MMNKFLQSDTVWRRFVSTLRGYAIVLLDEEGTVVAWNDGAKALKLYDAEEIIGKNFSVFYTSGARAIGHPEYELAAAASTGRYEEEGWRVRKGGSTFWAHVIVSPLFDNNVLCGFTKIIRDATEQKQMAAQYDDVMKLLEQTALTDYLTGLDNRRSLDRILTATLSRSRRYGG